MAKHALFGRSLAVMSFTILLGCVARERGRVSHDPAPSNTLDAAAEERFLEICAVPQNPTTVHQRGSRFTAVAFYKWLDFVWFFSADSRDGSGFLHRLFALAKRPEEWTLKAKASYRPETGGLTIETTEAHSFMEKIGLHAQLPRDRPSTLASLEETMVAVTPDTPPIEMKGEVVLFVDESGEFWSRLERMHRCSVEALTKAK